MKKFKLLFLSFLIIALSGCSQIKYFGGIDGESQDAQHGEEISIDGDGGAEGPGSGDTVDNTNFDGPGSGDYAPDGPGSGDTIENTQTDRPTGPGSGDTVENNAPEGPGSGETVENNLPEGPGSGETVDNIEPTGPGSGDEIPYEPEGPGSGDEIPYEEPTGPGSGEYEPEGPGSGDEVTQADELKDKAHYSCDTISKGSICVEYIGSIWANKNFTELNCGGAGIFKTGACPRPVVGGCNLSPGTANEIVSWFYNYGGDPLTPENETNAIKVCNANPFALWVYEK